MHLRDHLEKLFYFSAICEAGKFPLPVGSILVKDIFATDKITIRAQALMAKIADGVG
ncbi:hypothetical protein E3A20_22740, partial [Planctomyces bekefii]